MVAAAIGGQRNFDREIAEAPLSTFGVVDELIHADGVVVGTIFQSSMLPPMRGIWLGGNWKILKVVPGRSTPRAGRARAAMSNASFIGL
ncbi:MAG: hypothetical protein JWP63_3017 [Candidatus Solibacter sp.]|nr:hypothetical protein [Candidatus Solibacter sp.]